MLKEIKNWWSSFQNKVPTTEQPPQASQKLAKKQIQPLDSGLFGFLFNRIEVIMLVVMGVMALTLHFFFVEYVERQANFLTVDQDARFWFATRLVGSLLFLEITLALVTAFFRYRSEWDKSILTFLIAGIIAIFNQVTINEIFAELNGQNAIWGKMLLLNWLVFGIGESIGFVMHSKGSSQKSKNLTLDDLQHFLHSPTQVNKPNLYNPQGEVLADLNELAPIGFAYSNTPINRLINTPPPKDDRLLNDRQFLAKYEYVVKDWLIEDKSIGQIVKAYQGTSLEVSKSTIQKVKVVYRNVYHKKLQKDAQTKIFE